MRTDTLLDPQRRPEEMIHRDELLWIPEVGGAVDPGSDAHDLVMSLYGGMSKGERNRIKIRVRSAMAAQAATEDRFLGGRPPYGYRLADAGPHPNPSKAADGRRLHRLEPDPLTAPVVARIYRESLAGSGIYAIAEGLTRGGIPSPSAADPRRNPHRHGNAWAKSAVRVILLNPRYAGRQVWNRQRKAEILIDIEDVALGHETKMRWNPTREWIYSAALAPHRPRRSVRGRPRTRPARGDLPPRR
ncbi:recombinase family protein [Micromonospora sp. NBC_01699]|uniref:recombinase family protein n=1 Tax=Micromonospora sp. NBC_01699 TaxID=2975984 RepID=UPI002E29140B|nr:recombinase family protein [Micromonospora sp. NBC_01699]